MFLEVLPWGGTWDVGVLSITGQPVFDYVFTLGIVFALLAFMLGILFRLVSRS